MPPFNHLSDSSVFAEGYVCMDAHLTVVAELAYILREEAAHFRARSERLMAIRSCNYTLEGAGEACEA